MVIKQLEISKYLHQNSNDQKLKKKEKKLQKYLK